MSLARPQVHIFFLIFSSRGFANLEMRQRLNIDFMRYTILKGGNTFFRQTIEFLSYVKDCLTIYDY